MPHKVYQVHNGVMRTGMAPDGVHLDIGATDIGGKDVKPIVAMDHKDGFLKREGGDWEPFPSIWYSSGDIVWEVPDAVGQG